MLDWWFLQRYCLSVSLLPACLHTLDFEYKATHHGVNAQKLKATHQAAAKCPGLWPRPDMAPAHFLGSAFKAHKRRQCGGWGDTTPCSILCTQRSLLVDRIHRTFHTIHGHKRRPPCVFTLPSYTGFSRLNTEFLSSFQSKWRISKVNT